jgi:hypothetical protein
MAHVVVAGRHGDGALRIAQKQEVTLILQVESLAPTGLNVQFPQGQLHFRQNGLQNDARFRRLEGEVQMVAVTVQRKDLGDRAIVTRGLRARRRIGDMQAILAINPAIEIVDDRKPPGFAAAFERTGPSGADRQPTGEDGPICEEAKSIGDGQRSLLRRDLRPSSLDPIFTGPCTAMDRL